MQQLRIELLGRDEYKSQEAKRDLLLARLLEDMNDFAKDRFSEIVSKT